MKTLSTILMIFTLTLSLTLFASTTPLDSITESDTNGGNTSTEALGLQFTLVNNGTAYSVSRGYATANEIIIPETYNFLPVTNIANNAFDGFSSLSEITIPSSVTSIGNSAFWGCSSLSEITIPSNVTSIGPNAFANCSSLTTLIIPNSVTSIEYSAFYGCSSLTQINIPSSVTSIGIWAFDNCSSLASITVDINNTYYRSENNCLIRCYDNLLILGCQNSIIPTSVTNIGQSAFSGCSSLSSITIPSSVTNIGQGAFSGCSNLTEITISSSVTRIEYSTFSSCSSLTSITIPSSVTSIGDRAFSNCISLMQIDIPSSVTSIENEAFVGCSSLTEITIPSSVTSIGYSAFSVCSSLTEITIPSSVTCIENAAFYGCSSLSTITIPSSVTSIGSGAFSGCSSLTEINIPSSVTSIGSSAFSICSCLTSFTIPNSITSIGDMAFWWCSNLTEITIPSSVTSIGYGAFWGCSSLIIFTELINQPEGWDTSWNSDNRPVVWGGSNGTLQFTLINNGSAYSVSRGTVVTTVIEIPETFNAIPVTTIAENAFSGFCSLSNITLPSSVTSIGERAFYDCSNLLQISIPTSLTSIGDYAFQGCSSLMQITIPSSVTNIGFQAFWECSSLTEINIPASVTSIGDYAFSGCSSLTSIIVDVNNTVYKSENNCLIQREYNRLILGCQNSIIPSSVIRIHYFAFWYCRNLTEITIPNSVTSIGGYAFRDCSSLTEITIPSSMTSIEYYAFSNCSSLTNINIPSSVTGIESGAFSGCSSLTSIIIPTSVTVIGSGVFHGCSSLTAISIPSSVTSISNSTFYGCSSLTSITIPPNVTSIGEHAFYGCSSLTEITIPASVASIGNNAFSGCSSLTEITIPSSVSNIGYSAFSGCSSLSTITIPTSVTSIGEYAFDGCSSLIIFAEDTSQPEGWVSDWNGNRPVVYGITTDPIAPTALTHQISSNTVHLAWLPPTNVYTPDFISYAVYRDGELLTDADITNPSFLDTHTIADIHSYFVKAIYTTGESEPSNSINVLIPSNMFTPENLSINVDYYRVSLSWESGYPDRNTRAFTGYKVYRNDELLTDEPTNDTAFTDTRVPPGTYTYKVSALYTSGESNPIEIANVVVYDIQPPENLLASTTDALSVTLYWHSSASAGMTRYKIYRKASAEDEYTPLHQTENAQTLTYSDDAVDLDTTYIYYVTAVYPTGESAPSNTASATPVSDSDMVSVAVTSLKGNYPNPFNPTTTISFAMAKEGHITLEIYNSKGQKVQTLVNGIRGIGHHQVVWDGRDITGNSVASGIYFYKMTTHEYSSVRKMLMIK